MSTASSSSSSGIGVLGLLGIVFVTLKLLGITDVATWSWWAVTAPFWGGFALLLAILLMCGVVWLFAWVAEEVSRSRRRRR